MDKKQFDEQIKNALGKLNVPFDASSWDKLQNKIEEDPELTEQTEMNEQFDEEVRDKIENFEAPYNPNHWSLMAEEIRREFTFRGKLVRYKVAEFALMLLFLLTVNQYLPFIKEQVQLHKIDFQGESKSTEAVENTTAPFVEEKILKGSPITNPQASLEQESDSWAPFFFENESESGTLLDSSKQTIPFEVSLPIKHIKPFSDKEIIAVAANSSEDITRPDFNPNAAQVLDLNLLNIKDHFKPEITKLLAQSKATKFRFSIFSSLDYNYIKTPPDEVYTWLREYSRYAPGYGGGITFGMQFKKWEIETGGIYASKEYQPRIPTEVIGNFALGYTEVGFENIQLNMLEVPLNVRYRLADSGRWRFYGQTGASVHLAMQANYDKYPANLSDLLARPSAAGEPGPRLEKKKFPDGLIEGGNFKENSYFTANLGVGIEHLVNTRWSLFFQPSVQAYLLPGYNYGLGPNLDRISSISILTGARVYLW